MSGIPYNPALDGLRAIAVLMVIEYHGPWHTLGWTGYLGVDVFFVLSGFLITSILLREQAAGGIRLGQFYLRRARRLYPALCVLVVALLAVGLIEWRGATKALLYVGDYMQPSGALAHTWSLAVEEHYYLLWPLAIPALVRMKRPHAIALLAVAYVAASAWAAYNPWEWRANFRFDTRMSGLIAGSLLAFLPRTTLVPAVAMVVAYAALLAGYYPALRAFTEAVTACVIVLSYQMELPFLARPAFVYVGRISYGMYLFHWPVTHFMEPYAEGLPLLLLIIGATIACAALSFHTVEAWFRYPKRQAHTSMLEPAAKLDAHVS